jgi:hypothetical protein
MDKRLSAGERREFSIMIFINIVDLKYQLHYIK